jgi:RNA-binding protein with serine-rich domain 1
MSSRYDKTKEKKHSRSSSNESSSSSSSDRDSSKYRRKNQSKNVKKPSFNIKTDRKEESKSNYDKKVVKPEKNDTNGNTQNPLESTTKVLLVSNISRNVSKSHLQEIFGGYGKIKEMVVPKDELSNLQKDYFFLEFLTEDDADKCILYMDGAQIDGLVIKIEVLRAPKETEEKVIKSHTSNKTNNERRDKGYSDKNDKNKNLKRKRSVSRKRSNSHKHGVKHRSRSRKKVQRKKSSSSSSSESSSDSSSSKSKSSSSK